MRAARAYRAYHKPVGNPCATCGLWASRHIVDHPFLGKAGLCERDGCGLPRGQHKQRANNEHRWAKNRPPRTRPPKPPVVYIGIDGEGQDADSGIVGPDGKPVADHRYTMLAASTIEGDRSWVAYPSNPRIGRLTTEECLDLILELPSKGAKVFSYSFNYDLTKMLMDLPNESLYLLFRPELRQRKGNTFKGPYPVEWRGPNDVTYELNLQGTKFTVRANGKRVVIWDLFKFFQGKFVDSLRKWKVGEEEAWKRMSAMKDKRADFAAESIHDIEAYCLEECRCIAALAKKLVDSHELGGLTLKSFYGAGSSGSAMLEAMGIRAKLAPAPDNMKDAIAAAFFGGRFENSVIGPVRRHLYNFDISSAYPYQLTFLPCLEHGTWSHTTRRKDLERAEAQNGALVRYTLGANPGIESWGPFPFRSADGSISFPIESGGGWIWLDEYLVGERLYPHVQFREAFVYSANCDCKPFAQIPEYYNLRLRIDKDGPGLVIKLGVNSCYGKLAQSVGSAVFNSWIWAGMITSGCRAQLLTLMGLHKDWSNVLMMATDGLVTSEEITPPEPLFTGTGETGKPLGGWERKEVPRGMFFARPGIYFPMEPTEEELEKIRARGIGRAAVVKHWRKITEAWEAKGLDGVAHIDENMRRFCGGKTTVSRRFDKETKRFVYRRANGGFTKEGRAKPAYGQWTEREVALTFAPKPKREGLHPDGLHLLLRKFPCDVQSLPYKKALRSPEARELERAKLEMLEQPDGDLTEAGIDANYDE